MKFKVPIASLLVFLAGHFDTFGQGGQVTPEVGKKLPYFELTNVRNYRKGRMTNDDFKGKWFILDFWSLSCRYCIASFPKLREIQSEVEGKMYIVQVGHNTIENKGIEAFYEKRKLELDLTMASAFDSVLFDRWDIHMLPTIYIVDPDGIVRFRTDGRDMSPEKIKWLIDGKTVSFYSLGDDAPQFELSQIDETKDNNPIFHSVLTNWNGEQQRLGRDIDLCEEYQEELKKDGWVIAMAPLYWLYNFAYLGRQAWTSYDTAFYGKIYPFPVLAMRDSSLFQYDFDFNLGKGLYNFGFKMPSIKMDPAHIMRVLQGTLKQVFEYSISIEERPMPIWKLIAKSNLGQKLYTNGGKHSITWNGVLGFAARNESMKNCLDAITAYLPMNHKCIYLDATGINERVDMLINADMTQYEEVLSALHKQGLDLVRDKKCMKVLVIKDPE